MNLVLDIDSFNLPWVAVLQPIVRNLDLGSIFNDLSEDTILISDTITPCRIIERGHRIQKACSQSSETSVSQGWVNLFLSNSFKRIAKIFQGLLILFLKVKIGQSIGQTPSNQELQRYVIHFFLSGSIKDPMTVIKTLNQPISD